MRIATVVVCLLLAACATQRGPDAPQDATYFADERFAASAVRIDPADIFALSPAMRAYLDTEIEPHVRKRGRQVALVDALYRQGDLRLDYDTALTRNAAEAFAARSGNCLSLVIMTAAFARALDLHVEYQKVMVEDTWARAGDLYLAIGHVNLSMGKRRTDEGGYGHRVGKRAFESEGMIVDFLPSADLVRMRSVVIGERTIAAMYMNNRAVEALAENRVDDAYWWARAAILQNRDYLVAYNTLGAIYQRHGDLDRAEPVLRFVLAREPASPQTLANLVAVLDAAGKSAEARSLAAELARLEPEPPFAFYQQGLAALRAGDARAARDLFRQELARSPDYHEFHFWLAVAHQALGESDEARRHLAIAVRNSSTPQDRDLYAAKLARLGGAHP